jgi:hypothetical protein
MILSSAKKELVPFITLKLAESA